MKKMLSIIIMAFIFISCSEKSDSKKINPDDYEVSGILANGIRTVQVESYQFGFEPEFIVVNSGEKIVLELTTRDVKHGFMLYELNINVDISPGEAKTVEFTAEEKGVYEFWCSVPCGSGHREMDGLLIVK